MLGDEDRPVGRLLVGRQEVVGRRRPGAFAGHDVAGRGDGGDRGVGDGVRDEVGGVAGHLGVGGDAEPADVADRGPAVDDRHREHVEVEVLGVAQLRHEVAEARDHRELAALEQLHRRRAGELGVGGRDGGVAQDRQRLAQRLAGGVVGEGERRGLAVVVEDLAVAGVDEGREPWRVGSIQTPRRSPRREAKRAAAPNSASVQRSRTPSSSASARRAGDAPSCRSRRGRCCSR